MLLPKRAKVAEDEIINIRRDRKTRREEVSSRSKDAKGERRG